MDNICLALFKTPLTNQLGSSFNKKMFPEVSKRYVWSRISGAFRQHAEVIAGLGISGYQSHKRHQEAMAKQEQANQIAERQAEEAKRANDWQERSTEFNQQAKEIINRKAGELDPSAPAKSKGWLWCSEEKDFSSTLVEIFEKIF